MGLWLSPLVGYVRGQAMRYLAVVGVGVWLSPLLVSGDCQALLRQLALGRYPLVSPGDGQAGLSLVEGWR